MTVSAVSNAAQYQPTSQQDDVRQAFKQLVTSINSGDLTGAQQAYTTLDQLNSAGQGASTDSSSPVR